MSWFDLTLGQIILEYKDGSDEPLDGDGVDDLISIIRNKINFHEGNITELEYENLMNA